MGRRRNLPDSRMFTNCPGAVMAEVSPDSTILYTLSVSAVLLRMVKMLCFMVPPVALNLPPLWGKASVSKKRMSFRGSEATVGIRSPRSSVYSHVIDETQHWENGLPHQCAHWFAMTWFFDSLTFPLWGRKVLSQASMVEMVRVVSSNTSSSTLMVSRAVNRVTLCSVAI